MELVLQNNNKYNLDIQMIYFIIINIVIFSTFIMQIFSLIRRPKKEIKKESKQIQVEEIKRESYGTQTEVESLLRNDASVQTGQEQEQKQEGSFRAYGSNYPEGIEYGTYRLPNKFKTKCWRINGKIVMERKVDFSEETKRLFTDQQKEWYENSL